MKTTAHKTYGMRRSNGHYNTTGRHATGKWKHIEVLKFDLHDTRGNVILAAGTKDVDFVPHGGSFTYLNSSGERVRANKYRDSSGRVYYGYGH